MNRTHALIILYLYFTNIHFILVYHFCIRLLLLNVFRDICWAYDREAWSKCGKRNIFIEHNDFHIMLMDKNKNRNRSLCKWCSLPTKISLCSLTHIGTTIEKKKIRRRRTAPLFSIAFAKRKIISCWDRTAHWWCTKLVFLYRLYFI